MVPLDFSESHKYGKELGLMLGQEQMRHPAKSEQNRSWRRSIRVVIQQPALAKYRVPVFRELAKREGIELKVIYDRYTGILPNCAAQGFKVEHVPMRIFSLPIHPLYWHSAQWRYASREHCDVLVLSWDLHYASLIPALVRAHLNGVPTILWGHGYSKHEAGWRKRLRRSVARLATALLFYNCGSAQAFIASGWDPRRIHTALNSLDQAPIQEMLSIWAKRTSDLEAFRKKNRLGRGQTILFVSRLLYENRVDLLLKAVAELTTEKFRYLTLVLVGDGPDEARLRALAEKLGVGEQLRMQGPIYDEMQLAPWFLSADVFCYPTNIGLSLLHAFGYGLPVVTSNNIDAQNPEIEALEDGQNGMLYEDGDIQSLATTLDRILSDKGLRQRMEARALQTVANRFSLSTMVDGMERAVRYSIKQVAAG